MKRKLWTLLLALGAALALCVGASATDFTGWTALMDAHSGHALADGNYYLNNDVTISQTITVSGTITLDLNGHVLQYKNDNTKGSVIVIENGGQLTIQDSDPDAPHKFDPNSDGLWVLDEASGTETVTGGVITGGTGYPYQLYSTVNCGGGVYIAPGGQLTMTGGNIIGCSAEYGGGVCIYPKRDGEQGQFSMSGGSIIGCSAESGGGVCAFGKFQMSGQAVIRSCTVESTIQLICGGGVYVNGSSSFEMSGEAKIEGCQAIATSAYGGGVYVSSSSSFVMTDKAEIEGCRAIANSNSSKAPVSSPRKPAKRLRGEKEAQRCERALTYKISRSKRYKACSDLVRVVGVEPTRIASQEPKSCASANSAIPAFSISKIL